MILFTDTIAYTSSQYPKSFLLHSRGSDIVLANGNCRGRYFCYIFLLYTLYTFSRLGRNLLHLINQHFFNKKQYETNRKKKKKIYFLLFVYLLTIYSRSLLSTKLKSICWKFFSTEVPCDYRCDTLNVHVKRTISCTYSLTTVQRQRRRKIVALHCHNAFTIIFSKTLRSEGTIFIEYALKVNR